MPLTYKEIAEIIKLIDASSCDEFVVEVGDLKIAVRRRGAGAQPGTSSPVVRASPPGPTASNQPRKGAGAANPQTAPAKTPPAPGARAEGSIEVRSPMTGMFYSRPAPDAEPFVTVGARVQKGDPLCLVEVMKLFTTIHAELSGRVAAINAQDGQLVEHDQVLFLIDPA